MPAPKTIVPECSLGLATFIFVTGLMMLGDCPVYLAGGALAAIIPAIWRTGIWRAAGICLCMASIIVAVMQVQHIRAHEVRYHQLQDSSSQK